jgi:hypothetical protein
MSADAMRARPDGVLVRYRIVIAICLSTCLAWALARAPVARAGTYTVYSCRTPDGSAGSMDDWQFGAVNPRLDPWSSSCPSGPLIMRLDPGSGHAAGEYVVGDFVAPADTTIARYTLQRTVAVTTSSPYYYSESEGRGGDYAVYDNCWATNACSGLGDSTSPFGPTSAFTRADATGRLTALRIKAGCSVDGQSACGAVAGAGVEVRLYQATITLADTSAPVMATAPSGPLVSSAPLTGAQLLSISTSDRGSGIYQVALEVDGTVVQRATLDANGGRCQMPFTRAAPCPLSVSGTLTLDTTQFADGAHQLRILVTDAAGNTTPWGPAVMTTANGVCNPSPAGTGMRVTASFRPASKKHRRRRTSTVTRYGRRVTVSGRLRGADGSPVPGASICVVSRKDEPGAGLRVEGQAQTDATGHYAFTVESGPSRRIWFVHRVGDGAVSAAVRLGVRTYVKLRPSRRALRNGQRLGLTGQTARPTSSRGVLVLLEVRRGDHWQVFKRAHADRRGRFATTYRFTRTVGTLRYRFRALVPAQEGYPYATGASRSVVVDVAG